MYFNIRSYNLYLTIITQHQQYTDTQVFVLAIFRFNPMKENVFAHRILIRPFSAEHGMDIAILFYKLNEHRAGKHMITQLRL